MKDDTYALIRIDIVGTGKYYYALTKAPNRYMQFIYESLHAKSGTHTSTTGLSDYLRRHGLGIDDCRITVLEHGPYADILYARKKAIKTAWLNYDFDCLNNKHMNSKQLSVDVIE